MAPNSNPRLPRALWHSRLVAILTSRFGERLGPIRPVSVLLAAERVADVLGLPSAANLLPIVREGSADSPAVSLLLSYLEGSRRSGEYAVPPEVRGRPPRTDETGLVARANGRGQAATTETNRPRASDGTNRATTIPAPPIAIDVDDSPRAFVDRARRLAAAGHSDEALRLLATAIAIDAAFEEAYVLASAIADAIGRTDVIEALARRDR